MAKRSAGLLMFRRRDSDVEVLLIHPGGPYWTGKDNSAWSIPKGEIEIDEREQDAAKREFEEETGLVPRGELYPLKPVRLKSGKAVYAWFFEGDWDPMNLKSSTFAIEWPPRSGRIVEYPEADRAAWFTLEEAMVKIQQGQIGFLEELSTVLVHGSQPRSTDAS